MGKLSTIAAARRARQELIVLQPFFGRAACALELIALRDGELPEVQTAATDGKRIVIRPEWWDALCEDHQRYVLAHEVMHVVYEHPWRTKGLIGEPPALPVAPARLADWQAKMHKANIAADHAVNNLLNSSGMQSSMPPKATCDAKYKGWSFERIFADLPDAPPAQQFDCGGFIVAGGVEEEGGDPSQGVRGNLKPSCKGQGGEVAQAQLMEVRAMVAAAAASAGAGCPDSIRRQIDDQRAPSMDYREMLERYVTDAVQTETSWARPRRRFASQGLYLPSLKGYQIGTLGVVIDSSGSISRDQLSQFMGDVRSLGRLAKGLAVAVGGDAVRWSKEFTDAQDVESEMPKEPPGADGTDFAPLIEHMVNLSDPPDVLLYFTDLDCFGRWGDEPPFPVVWVCWAQHDSVPEVPYGRVVMMPREVRE